MGIGKQRSVDLHFVLEMVSLWVSERSWLAREELMKMNGPNNVQESIGGACSKFVGALFCMERD